MLSYDKPVLLAGGMKAWSHTGMPMVALPQMTVQELAKNKSSVQVLDVRWDSEFKSGSIAVSILQRDGYEKVRNVSGSMQAWKNAGYDVEK